MLVDCGCGKYSQITIDVIKDLEIKDFHFHLITRLFQGEQLSIRQIGHGPDSEQIIYIGRYRPTTINLAG